jgi:transketolase
LDAKPDATLAVVRSLLSRATGDEKHDESSTSTIDALWVLYDRVLHVNPADPTWEERDRFILSKGHGPAAYYAVLAAKGFFPAAWLDGFMEHANPLGSHPDRLLVPGVEASTGSLGHGLPIAVGVALALGAKALPSARVVVLCGDAELNEGTNWEAIMLGAHLRLSNLTLLIIDNHSSTISMEPWDQKLGAFGWATHLVNGHDREALEAALRAVDPSAPSAVVADIPQGEW